jgi:hypothetical protein
VDFELASTRSELDEPYLSLYRDAKISTLKKPAQSA